jgi:hypothetical protein
MLSGYFGRYDKRLVLEMIYNVTSCPVMSALVYICCPGYTGRTSWKLCSCSLKSAGSLLLAELLFTSGQ